MRVSFSANVTIKENELRITFLTKLIYNISFFRLAKRQSQSQLDQQYLRVLGKVLSAKKMMVCIVYISILYSYSLYKSYRL